MPGKDLSQGAKRQGQWIRAEPGNGWRECGGGPGGGAKPSETRACARTVREAEPRTRSAQAREGGVQEGAGQGRGRGVGEDRRSRRPWRRCWLLRGRRLDGRECDGTAPRLSPILGRAGRWATGSRAAAEEAARPPHGESRGSGPGSRDARGCLAPGRSASGRRARCPWPSVLWDDPRSPRPLSRAACGAAGRPDAPAPWCCDGKGPRDARAAAFLHREIRARLRCPGISKPGCSRW